MINQTVEIVATARLPLSPKMLSALLNSWCLIIIARIVSRWERPFRSAGQVAPVSHRFDGRGMSSRSAVQRFSSLTGSSSRIGTRFARTCTSRSQAKRQRSKKRLSGTASARVYRT